MEDAKDIDAKDIMEDAKDLSAGSTVSAAEPTGRAMDLWRKDRWMLFYIITWLYLVLELAIIYLRISGLQGLYPIYRLMVWPEAILGLFVIISLAQVMQYFLELPRVVAGVYLYALTNFVIVTIAVGRIPVAAIGTISLVPLLYFIICLFRVRAPEVSVLFKWIGVVEILAIGFNIAYNSLHLWDSGLWDNRYIRLLPPSLERLIPYVLILVVLTKMMHLPPTYITMLEKDIDSIGE